MAVVVPPKSFHVTNNSVQAVSSSPGMLGGYFLDNTANAATTYYQFFFKPSTSVSLGSTVADIVIPIPAGLGANLELAILCPALSFAVTTTFNGSTAAASATDSTIFYG